MQVIAKGVTTVVSCPDLGSKKHPLTRSHVDAFEVQVHALPYSSVIVDPYVVSVARSSRIICILVAMTSVNPSNGPATGRENRVTALRSNVYTIVRPPEPIIGTTVLPSKVTSRFKGHRCLSIRGID